MKISELQPERVFYYFEKLCEIPHGSGNTRQISDFCVATAKKLGLSCKQDKLNNVVIVKEATDGYEDADTVMLQGHLDMVCEKTADCQKDMEKEGPEIYISGDEVRARDTTLGGDDGIAVAMILAILEDETLEHPRLEAVFTVDEEIGLLGAEALDVSRLQAKKMINLDSEEEGIFTVSCAGGNTLEGKLPIDGECYSGEYCELRICGLLGGHSGAEIHLGRANSNVLMGRVLNAIRKECRIRLLSIDGGSKDNAIPLDTVAEFVCEDKNKVIEIVEKLRDIVINEYRTSDPDIRMIVSFKNCEEKICYNEDSTEKMITLLRCLPNGVQKMSLDIENLVQTSLNLGVVKTEKNEMTVSFCVRSSVDSERCDLNDEIDALLSYLGGTVEIRGAYSGWAYKEDSPLRDCMCRVFEKDYGKAPVVEAIHAGLECGLFAGKMPGLDCVSVGPDLQHVHTVNECMSIPSVQRVYQFICHVLTMLK